MRILCVCVAFVAGTAMAMAALGSAMRMDIIFGTAYALGAMASLWMSWALTQLE